MSYRFCLFWSLYAAYRMFIRTWRATRSVKDHEPGDVLQLTMQFNLDVNT